MSHISLRLYRFIEDAWNDDLRDWCEARSLAALKGYACWIVVASRGQARWIKRRALSEGLTLFGIKFLEPQMLRRELCALFGVEALSLGRETLEFLLKIAALKHDDADSKSISQNAGACLRAMDDLAAAGWSEKEFDVLPQASRDFFKTLKNSHSWTPELDRLLLKRATKKPLLSCVIGWDAAHFTQLDLLEALAHSSDRCDLFAPMPRSSSESLQQRWIESLETRLNTNKTTCDASGFSSANESLVSRLEGSDLAAENAPKPQLLVGRDWNDEIKLVRDDVISWLANSSPNQRLAIIVQRRTPSSLAIVRELAAADVALLDETGEKIEATLDVLIQSQIVRYDLRGCDVEPLLELIKLLNENSGKTWSWLDPETAHALLDDAFSSLQTRNARLLMRGFKRGDERCWPQIVRLIEQLGKWSGELTWSAARAKWEASLAPLGLTTQVLEPLWSRVGDLLGEEKISARIFIEYIDEMLAGRNSQRATDAASAHARVVVTTLANALHQTWDRVVFLDSNEGIWPQKPEENPFLDDAARGALNARRGQRAHLLATGDQSALDQSHFLDLIEHCTGEIVFASTARESGEGAREAYPNEWVIRCLIESHGSDAKSALGAWKNAMEICSRLDPALQQGEREHLENVHTCRNNPTIPFDKYLFNFGESQFSAQSWSAAKLDEALTCPATFALREIFHTESLRDTAWKRSESTVVGSHTHAWLARALDGSEDFKPLPPRNFNAELDAEISASLQRLRDYYAHENLPLPIWWETCLRKAAWIARRCLASIAEIDGKWFFAMEKRMRQEVCADAAKLRLKGRFDFVLSDRAAFQDARMQIVDFKTGKSDPPTLATLAKGNGFQFAAYFLMAKDAGAASVSVGIIRHDMTKLESFTDADDAVLRELISPLAKLQRDLNFGRLGPLVAEWGRCETLPMATITIAPEVLEQKAELLLLAK